MTKVLLVLSTCLISSVISWQITKTKVSTFYENKIWELVLAHEQDMKTIAEESFTRGQTDGMKRIAKVCNIKITF